MECCALGNKPSKLRKILSKDRQDGLKRHGAPAQASAEEIGLWRSLLCYSSAVPCDTIRQ